MEEEEPTPNEVLGAMDTYLDTSLFTESLLDINDFVNFGDMLEWVYICLAYIFNN